MQSGPRHLDSWMLNSYLSGATDSSNLGFSILKNGNSVKARGDHGAYGILKVLLGCRFMFRMCFLFKTTVHSYN
jgi:hypothetical protein